METGLTAKELGALRKRLQKEELEQLQNGSLFSEVIQLLSVQYSGTVDLEILSLQLTLFRQLRSVLESSDPEDAQNVADLIHTRVAPLLHPGQPIADTLLSSIESPNKLQVLRATDVLSAVGRMADILPLPSSSTSTPSNLLVPIFQHVASARTISRSELVMLNALISHIPTDYIPSKLVGRILEGMDSLDSATLRSNIVTNILLRTHENGESSTPETKALRPLLPLLDSNRPPVTLLNLTRYLLPALFSSRPALASSLLAVIDQTPNTNISAWISVASLSVSLGHTDIADLPSARLQSAIHHEGTSVRTKAFQLLASSRQLLRADTLDLIKESFKYNAVLPSSGGRSEFVSAVHAFFNRLKDSQKVFKRLYPTDPQIALSKDFHAWLLTDFIDPGLSVSCRHPVLRSILALGILKTYLDIFGHEADVQKRVFTEDRVQSLFVCQMSEFTEVRIKARNILENAKVPLPNNETWESQGTQALYNSALASLNHPRKVQAEAGKSTLCIIFQKLLCGPEPDPRATAFVTTLLDVLGSHIRAAESDLVIGIEKSSLHGIIAAVNDVITCIRLVTPGEQDEWRPILERALILIDRIWIVIRPVISLAPSDQSKVADNPEHEIARAYEVLGGGDEEEEAENLDHTNLLSGCWRAATQSGELLATIFGQPLLQAKAEQAMWTEAQVHGAGQRFLTWMHEIRHRGTFSKIALAFTGLVNAVKSVPSLVPLCRAWLSNELEIITRDSLSTTRRSAALPYSVLAITSGDEVLLDIAFERLDDLARVDNAQSSDITKIHAFNILKIVLLDARQSKLLDRYFERAVMTSLHAFSSANWNVRNVGLILFSTLVNRSLSPARGIQDFYASRSILATRQALANWNAKYPLIIPYIRQYLKKHSAATPSTSNAHSPLFPVLIIVRSLRWSAAGSELATDLFEVVEPYLASPEWQIRSVAAQALSSLVSPDEAVKQMVELGISEEQGINAKHGKLLFVRHLIAEVIEWSEVSKPVRQEIESSISRLLRDTEPIRVIPTIATAIIDILTSYIRGVPHPQLALISALEQLTSTASSAHDDLPGQSLLRQACAEGAMDDHAETDGILSALAANTASVDSKLATLTYLMDVDLSEEVLDSGVLIRIMFMSISLAESDEVRLAALDVLAEIPWPRESLSGVSAQRQSTFVKILMDQYRSTRSVPLKEAILAGLGWALAWSMGTNAVPESEYVAPLIQLVGYISKASVPEESQPSRYAALQALRPFVYTLFPRSPNDARVPDATFVNFHRLALRFLQDDDEEIRWQAANIVRRGMHVDQAVCWHKGMELEWGYLAAALKWSTCREELLDMIWGMFADQEHTDIDLEVMERITGRDPTSVLFEVEPPNLFRDPLSDVAFAADVLVEIPLQWWSKEMRARVEGLRGVHEKLQGVVGEGADVSPIDRSFDASRRARQRMDIQRRALRVIGGEAL